jgi:hypothetical protein
MDRNKEIIRFTLGITCLILISSSKHILISILLFVAFMGICTYFINRMKING